MGKTIRDELKDKYLKMGGRQEDLTNSSQTIDGMIHAINKLDGGEMSNDILCIKIIQDPEMPQNRITDITYADFNNAWLNDKLIFLRRNYTFLQYSGRSVKNGHTYVYFEEGVEIDDDDTGDKTLVLKKTSWSIDFDNSNEDGAGNVSSSRYTYTCTVDDVQLAISM